jgi:hypothetical protein
MQGGRRLASLSGGVSALGWLAVRVRHWAMSWRSVSAPRK